MDRNHGIKTKKRSLSASMDSYGGDGGILKIPKICGFIRVFSPFSALFMTVFTSILYILPIFCQYFCNKKRLDVAATTVKPRSEITIE